MSGRSIQVKIGSELSSKHVAETGTHRGSVVSPALFSVTINDIFINIQMDTERSLFAEDGALRKRGRNVIHQVDMWETEWGF